MKITLVVDTDDRQGIIDSFKIVSHFYKRQGGTAYAGAQVKYGKIAFIKMLRKFAREARDAEQEGIDSASLRFAKQWADIAFNESSL
tara:strand:- start:218 stop:478 length:261 start_codon:yes stop_codon:yes gene_type:complete